MTLGKLNTYVTHKLVIELAWLISCETVLCFLHNLNVTNNDFEHACYVLSHLHIVLEALVSYFILKVTTLEFFFW